MRQIIRYFAHDLTASKTAELIGLMRSTVIVLFVKIRRRGAQSEDESSSLFEAISRATKIPRFGYNYR